MARRDYSIFSLSEARREERGHDRLFLRPPAPCADILDQMKETLRTTRSLAAAYAIHRVAKELEGMTADEIAAAIALVKELEDVKP